MKTKITALISLIVLATLLGCVPNRSGQTWEEKDLQRYYKINFENTSEYAFDKIKYGIKSIVGASDITEDIKSNFIGYKEKFITKRKVIVLGSCDMTISEKTINVSFIIWPQLESSDVKPSFVTNGDIADMQMKWGNDIKTLSRSVGGTFVVSNWENTRKP